MPITINELVEKAGLNPKTLKKVKWGTPIGTQKEGVYIVSLSESPDVNKTLKKFPISMSILQEWINKVGGFTLDKELTNNAESINRRLAKFWLSDESILYIGKAPIRKNGNGLGNRIQEYYDTCFGERRPHAGGHWIKLLSNLQNLYVYYIECPNSEQFEKDMMNLFGASVSETSKQQLAGTGVILPFANLEDGNKIRKKHGLGHMKK